MNEQYLIQKKSLFLDFYVFNYEGKEIKPGRFYDNFAYFISNKQMDSKMKVIHDGANFNIGKCLIVPKRVYFLGDLAITFADVGKNYIIGEIVENIYVQHIEPIKIYTSIDGCLIDTTNSQLNYIKVSINGTIITNLDWIYIIDNNKHFLNLHNLFTPGLVEIEITNTLSGITLQI